MKKRKGPGDEPTARLPFLAEDELPIEISIHNFVVVDHATFDGVCTTCQHTLWAGFGVERGGDGLGIWAIGPDDLFNLVTDPETLCDLDVAQANDEIIAFELHSDRILHALLDLYGLAVGGQIGDIDHDLPALGESWGFEKERVDFDLWAVKRLCAGGDAQRFLPSFEGFVVTIGGNNCFDGGFLARLVAAFDGGGKLVLVDDDGFVYGSCGRHEL